MKMETYPVSFEARIILGKPAVKKTTKLSSITDRISIEQIKEKRKASRKYKLNFLFKLLDLKSKLTLQLKTPS